VDGGEVHGQVGDDRRVRLGQLHDDREIVTTLLDRLEQVGHAHVVEVVIGAARDLGVGMLGLPHALEGPDHVIGVEVAGRREAVDAGMELDALAQLEGDGLAVFRDIVQDSASAGSTVVVPGVNWTRRL
jgi:predicted RNA methylase